MFDIVLPTGALTLVVGLLLACCSLIDSGVLSREYWALTYLGSGSQNLLTPMVNLLRRLLLNVLMALRFYIKTEAL